MLTEIFTLFFYSRCESGFAGFMDLQDLLNYRIDVSSIYTLGKK